MKKVLLIGGAALVGGAIAAAGAALAYDKLHKESEDSDGCDSPCCEDPDCERCVCGGQTTEPEDEPVETAPDAGVLPGGAIFTPTQAAAE